MDISYYTFEYEGILYEIKIRKKIGTKREYSLFVDKLRIGRLMLSLKNKTIIIEFITVIDPIEYSHRGYGSKFIEILEKMAKTEGYNQLLAVNADGLDKLYVKHCNFKKIDDVTFSKIID